MELTQLKYFLAVVEAGSITKAARKLFITQSALSRVILRLEEELQAQLFDRSPGKVTLNDNGKLFHLYVTRAMESLEQGVRALAVAEGRGNAEVCICSRLITDILSFLCDSCQAAFPHVNFTFYEAEQQPPEGTEDIVICADKAPEGMEVYGRYRDQWCVILNRDYPRTYEKGITLEELAGEPLAFCGPAEDERFLRSVFERADLRPSMFTVQDMDRSAVLINKGLAVGCVPVLLYYQNTYQFGRKDGSRSLRALPLLDVELKRDILLCSRRRFAEEAATGEILKRVAEEVAEAMEEINSFYRSFLLGSSESE